MPAALGNELTKPPLRDVIQYLLPAAPVCNTTASQQQRPSNTFLMKLYHLYGASYEFIQRFYSAGWCGACCMRAAAMLLHVQDVQWRQEVAEDPVGTLAPDPPEYGLRTKIKHATWQSNCM